MPCEQQVRVWFDEKGHETHKGYKLYCKDKCDNADSKDCVPKTRGGATPSGVSTTEEYCACDGGNGPEDKRCHIVLVTVTAGDDKGTQYYRCDESADNKCTKPEECLPSEVPLSSHLVPIPSKDGKYRGKLGRYAHYECKCQQPKKPKKP